MPETIHIKTKPDVLKWARESLVLSKQMASESLQISISRLEQLENGEKFPSMEELKSMSKTYKRTIATLLLQQVPAEKPLPKDRRTINSAVVNTFHESTVIAVRKARALVNSLIELKAEAGIPIQPFNIKANLTDSAKNTAQELRIKWNIDEYRQLIKTTEVLDALIEFVESLGVAVFQLSLTKDNLRGFSITDENMPVIVIKKGSEPPSAKIFTLFHELGHIMLNDGGLCDLTFNPESQQIEKWCNEFAAELLVPADQLLNMQIVSDYKAKNEKIWAQKDLIALANYFHVGPLAMLRRLLENDLTTSAYYKENHEKLNKPQFGRSTEGRNLPKEIIKERGKTYINLAFKIFDQNKIDLKDLSDYLGIKLSYIPKTRQLLNA